MYRIMTITVWLLVIKTVLVTWISYADYFPPNFQANFLLGRQSTFHGPYAVAFYVHILSGPVALLAGLFLMNSSWRKRFPQAHRIVGRWQLVCVLMLVVPSGMWMARFTNSGWLTDAAFMTLAVGTSWCAFCGWRTAINRQFRQHQIWMTRTFALLCSAVVLRIMGGLATLFAWQDTYPFAAWLSWFMPLAACEWMLVRFHRKRTRS